MMRFWVRFVVGLGFGSGLLWLALRDVDVRAVGAAMLAADSRYLAAGLALYWFDIGARIVRWRGLLRSTKLLRFPDVAQALIVGYAVNNVLPARLGEIFRADFLRRQFAVSRSAAVGSIIVERLLDGIVVVCLFVLGLALVTFETGSEILVMAAAAGGAGVLMAAAAVATFPAYYRRLPFATVPWIAPRLDAFVGALSVVRTRHFRIAAVWSVGIWAIESCAIACVTLACGVHLDAAALCVVVGAASLSTLLPSAPGYVGSLQIAYVAAFAALGESPEAAVVAATLTQVALLGSITVVGLGLLATAFLARPANGVANSAAPK
ncbi:MAG: lysylphosphatidylglycerol synthase transmembrane domain-containing protein [Rhodospirillaceae bacterium]